MLVSTFSDFSKCGVGQFGDLRTVQSNRAGSIHGIALLDEPDPARRSPLHFQRHRLALLERPHMHSTLALVPHDQPCPAVGDRVDVQRPLITSTPDLIEWT